MVLPHGRHQDGPAPVEWPHRKEPCDECPWVKGNVGKFPAHAFQRLALSQTDLSLVVFTCHMTPRRQPEACAGFLLRGAAHNLAVRWAVHQRRVNLETISNAGKELHENYREVAIANGVDPEDPMLKICREPEGT